MNKFLFAILFTSTVFANEGNNRLAFTQKNKSLVIFEICTEFMEKNGTRFQLGQIWFDSGEDPKEAKRLVNYTVDYNDKPFAYNFSFANIPKDKLWLDCVYFACGDHECSNENASREPESAYHEIKKIPLSCKSKVKKGNLTRIEYFTCKYK